MVVGNCPQRDENAQSEMEDWQKRRASLDGKRLKMIDNAKH